MKKRFVFAVALFAYLFFSFEVLSSSIEIEVHPRSGGEVALEYPGLYMTHVEVSYGLSDYILSLDQYGPITILLGGELMGKPMPGRVRQARNLFYAGVASVGSFLIRRRPVEEVVSASDSSGCRDVVLDPGEVRKLFLSQSEREAPFALTEETLEELPLDISSLAKISIQDLSIKAYDGAHMIEGPTLHLPGCLLSNGNYFIKEKYLRKAARFFFPDESGLEVVVSNLKVVRVNRASSKLAFLQTDLRGHRSAKVQPEEELAEAESGRTKDAASVSTTSSPRNSPSDATSPKGGVDEVPVLSVTGTSKSKTEKQVKAKPQRGRRKGAGVWGQART